MTVNGRVSDIWRSFIVERILRAEPRQVALFFTSFSISPRIWSIHLHRDDALDSRPPALIRTEWASVFAITARAICSLNSIPFSCVIYTMIFFLFCSLNSIPFSCGVYTMIFCLFCSLDFILTSLAWDISL
jgi:hypothetical protein